MMKKTRRVRGFVKIWVVLLVLALVALAARFVFLKPVSPTLSEVLARTPTRRAFDLPLLVASLLALSLATLSLAKGYEIFRRSKSIRQMVLPGEEPEPLDVYKEMVKERERDREIEGLRQNLEELTGNRESLREENERLRNRLRQGTADFELLKQFEQSLRKSNISLGRECERLKSENEQLLLEVSSLKVKPKPKGAGIKAKKKKIKRKSKK